MVSISSCLVAVGLGSLLAVGAVDVGRGYGLEFLILGYTYP